RVDGLSGLHALLGVVRCRRIVVGCVTRWRVVLVGSSGRHDRFSFLLTREEIQSALWAGRGSGSLCRAGASRRVRRRRKRDLADLVGGEAAVLGSCQGACPNEGTDTLAQNGL